MLATLGSAAERPPIASVDFPRWLSGLQNEEIDPLSQPRQWAVAILC